MGSGKSVPGIHCMRMRLISQDSVAKFTTVGCPRYDDVNIIYAAVLSIVQAIMAACKEDFDHSISYALQHLGCATMKLKFEQRASVKSIYEGKSVHFRIPNWIRQMRYKLLPFVFDVRLGRHKQVLLIAILRVHFLQPYPLS